MTKDCSNIELTIQFTQEEFAKLDFMAQRLDVTIPELIRSLIPSIHLKPHMGSAEESTTMPQQAKGPYSIRHDYDRDRLTRILNDLITNRIAKTLGEEIKAQLIDDSHRRDRLNWTTEKRLLRWTHPARIDERTRYVTPMAREICTMVFGFIPPREED
jgi:hypothetical protein